MIKREYLVLLNFKIPKIIYYFFILMNYLWKLKNIYLFVLLTQWINARELGIFFCDYNNNYKKINKFRIILILFIKNQVKYINKKL